MKPEKIKSTHIIVSSSWLDAFISDGWVIIGREEKRPNKLLRTEYTMGHLDADKKIPKQYAEYLKLAAKAALL